MTPQERKAAKTRMKAHDRLLDQLDGLHEHLVISNKRDAPITLAPKQWTLMLGMLDGSYLPPPGLDVKARAYKGHPLKVMGGEG